MWYQLSGPQVGSGSRTSAQFSNAPGFKVPLTLWYGAKHSWASRYARRQAAQFEGVGLGAEDASSAAYNVDALINAAIATALARGTKQVMSRAPAPSSCCDPGAA